LRLLAAALTAVAVFLAAGPTSAESAKQEKCTKVKSSIAFQRKKTWEWQEKLGVPTTEASETLRGENLWRHEGCRYLQWVSKLWQKRAASLKLVFGDFSKPASALSTERLYQIATYEVKRGGIYSSRWGDASSRLKEVCYELVSRVFSPYGTQGWARYVVNRESGCNPGAVNSKSGTTGIAQIHPAYHDYDYPRMKRDMKYALATFIRLSRGGKNTGPWCLC